MDPQALTSISLPTGQPLPGTQRPSSKEETPGLAPESKAKEAPCRPLWLPGHSKSLILYTCVQVPGTSPAPSLNSDPLALAHLSLYFAVCFCPLPSGPDSFALLLRSAETMVWKDQASDLPPEDKHSSPLNVLLLEALGTVHPASHPSTWCRTRLVELPGSAIPTPWTSRLVRTHEHNCFCLSVLPLLCEDAGPRLAVLSSKS